MKNTIVVNLFGSAVDVAEAGQYITRRLETLKVDVVRCYNTINFIDIKTPKVKERFMHVYDLSTEWLDDYYNITDVIVNECPVAQYAYYGQNLLSDLEKETIIKRSKIYNNFNVIIMPRQFFSDNEEIGKIINFLGQYGINGIYIDKTETHYDQIVKDVQDKMYPTLVTDTEEV